MEVQFANEVSQRGEMGDKLRKACLMMLEERLAKICKEKDAEIARLTTRSQEEIETMHERLVSITNAILTMVLTIHEISDLMLLTYRKQTHGSSG